MQGIYRRLERLAQEKFTDPEIGRLLDELQPYEESLPYESDEASLIRIARRHYEKMTKIPAKFVGELSEHGAKSYQLWAEARPENNFAKVQLEPGENAGAEPHTG